MSTFGPSLCTGPLKRRQTPGKANNGRGSLSLIANQCQVTGFTSLLGSQNEVAGTKQRRSTKDDSQKRS